MPTTDISNSDQVIDSRNVISRIEELEGEDLLEQDEQDELKALKTLEEEAEGYSDDWKHGSTLIRDDYFTEYAEELCKDIGDLPSEIPWYIEIDWEKTAEHIKADYTEVDFDGVSYWIR